jgi:hypothetical protein
MTLSLTLSLVFGTSVKRAALRTSAAPAAPRAARAGAFTLLEMLLCIVVVALLVALALPAVGRARARADEAVTLANLRSSHGVLAAYGNDHRESFPDFLNPKVEINFVRLADGRVVQIDRYFFASWFWYLPLVDFAYDGVLRPRSIYPGETLRRFGPGGPSFYMPCVFFAHADFWTPETRTGPEQWGGTRWPDVQFPAQKFLLTSYFNFHFEELTPHGERGSETRVPFVAVDGAARVARAGRIRPGMISGDGWFPPGSLHTFEWHPGQHTLGGVRGRDIDTLR